MNPTSEFETITPDKAKQLLDNNKSNRPVNERNLNALIMEMKRKNFHLTGESIKVAKNGNLLDGQHRLLAILKTGTPIRMLVVRGLDNDAFKYIDTGRTRKASDVLAIEGIENAGKIAAMVNFIIKFKKGSYFAAGNSENLKTSQITNADVSEFVNKNKASVAESYPFGYNKENRLVSPRTLAALHYIFKHISEDEANDFCHKLSTGADLTKESPIYQLRQYLLMDIRSTKKAPALHKIAMICKAWNLYRKNAKVSSLKWNYIKEAFPKPI